MLPSCKSKSRFSALRLDDNPLGRNRLAFALVSNVVLPIRRYGGLSWQEEDLPQSFRTVVENCFHLRALQGVHGRQHVLIRKSMKYLSLSVNHASIGGF